MRIVQIIAVMVLCALPWQRSRVATSRASYTIDAALCSSPSALPEWAQEPSLSGPSKAALAAQEPALATGFTGIWS